MVESALEIVTSQGADALTVQAVAERFGGSVGTIYRHFASKDELVRAVEAAQLRSLRSTAQRRADRLAAELAGADVTEPVAALARVLDAGWFWGDGGQPVAEVERARRLVDGPGAEERRVEAAGNVLDTLADALDGAARIGVLTDGDAHARASLVVAVCPAPATVGERWGQPVGGAELARSLLDCLLLAWGGAPDLLADATAFLHVRLAR
jgi:AcrR family transcriptional regulator